MSNQQIKEYVKKIFFAGLMVLLPWSVIIMLGWGTESERFYQMLFGSMLVIGPFWEGLLLKEYRPKSVGVIVVENKKWYHSLVDLFGLSLIRLLVFPLLAPIYGIQIYLGVYYWRNDDSQIYMWPLLIIFISYSILSFAKKAGKI